MRPAAALLLLAMMLVCGSPRSRPNEPRMPESTIEVVLAKFVASMTLIAAMLALSASYPVVLALYGNPDWGPVYSGYLGLILFAGALLAIGLLISSLTSNQFIAHCRCGPVARPVWPISPINCPRAMRSPFFTSRLD